VTSYWSHDLAGGRGQPVTTPENEINTTSVEQSQSSTPVHVNPLQADGPARHPIGQGLRSLAVQVEGTGYRTDLIPLDNLSGPFTPNVKDYIKPGWGSLYMTIVPGKGLPGRAHDRRPRHLGYDLDRIADRKIGVLATLLQPHELAHYKVPTLFSEAEKRGMQLEPFPILDVHTPTDMAATRAYVRKLIERLKHGENIALHCAGGKGRTGLIAACLLVELGMAAEEAIKTVRIARHGTIETKDQENFVRAYAKYVAETGGGFTP
jgi:protein-tyrosine phosphatase